MMYGLVLHNLKVLLFIKITHLYNIFIAPGEYPPNLRIVSHNHQSATLKWSELDCNLQNGRIIGYEVHIKRGNETVIDRVDASTTTYTVTFQKHRNFTFTLAAFNNVGVGVFAPPINVQVRKAKECHNRTSFESMSEESVSDQHNDNDSVDNNLQASADNSKAPDHYADDELSDYNESANENNPDEENTGEENAGESIEMKEIGERKHSHESVAEEENFDDSMMEMETAAYGEISNEDRAQEEITEASSIDQSVMEMDTEDNRVVNELTADETNTNDTISDINIAEEGNFAAMSDELIAILEKLLSC